MTMNPVNAPAIVIENLSYRHDKAPLFENLNQVFAAQRCHCILGSSGVGKSTLLRLIAGLEPDSNIQRSGTIRLHPPSPSIGQISWMAQQDLLLPWLSLKDNVLLGARLRREPLLQLEQQAEQLLNQLGLQNAFHKKIQQLSGGMRQRVALARTLMEQRAIFLMDEPFSALDAIHRYHLQSLTAEMTHDKTVLMVTHDPMEALRMAHSIHILTGQPAHFDKPLILAGLPPRDPADPEVLVHYSHLIKQLASAEEKVG